MKRGLNTRGYTIVEVLIVLAVTTGLLVAIMAGISGQQRKTEFSQSVNDFQAQINDIVNTVSTGYAVNTGDFTCSVSPIGTGPTLATPGSNTQGTNQDCIVLGRALQTAPLNNNSTYYIYTILGQRISANKKEASTLDNPLTTGTIPTALHSSNKGSDSFETGKIQGGVTVEQMYYTTDSFAGAIHNQIGAAAFLSSLGVYTNCSNLCSGATNVQLYVVKNTSKNQDPNDLTRRSQLDGTDNPTGINGTNLYAVPFGGSVVVCLKSGGTDQYGVVTIGSNNRQLTTKLDILASSVATDPITGLCK